MGYPALVTGLLGLFLLCFGVVTVFGMLPTFFQGFVGLEDLATLLGKAWENPVGKVLSVVFGLVVMCVGCMVLWLVHEHENLLQKVKDLEACNQALENDIKKRPETR